MSMQAQIYSSHSRLPNFNAGAAVDLRANLPMSLHENGIVKRSQETFELLQRRKFLWLISNSTQLAYQCPFEYGLRRVWVRSRNQWSGLNVTPQQMATWNK